jgi:tRNA A-37 threonylcarbamoyl transferase component Bud32
VTVTPAEAMRKMRADPTYRQKGLAWQRQYYRRNRDVIRYVAKCREAGIDMTMAKAREILCQLVADDA